MKLNEWAKRQGISYKTAWRWFKDGKLPVQATQASTGTIIVHVESQDEKQKNAVLYARVSGSDQKNDLERQLGRLAQYAANSGIYVSETVSEIGSGLNGKRSKLLKILKNPNLDTIVVEHRDRLARFGAEYIEAALNASDRKLIVIDQSEMQDLPS